MEGSFRTKLEELLDEEDYDWNSIRDIISENVPLKTISLTKKCSWLTNSVQKDEEGYNPNGKKLQQDATKEEGHP